MSRKAYNDGLARGREEAKETIAKMRAALTKALEENLAQRDEIAALKRLLVPAEH